MKVMDIEDGLLSPVLYGMRDESLTNYYKNKFDNIRPYINNDSSIFTNVYNDIQEKHSDEYIRKVKESLYELNLTGADDHSIYYYEDTRDANKATREWIMSNKKISNLYERKLISGYGNSNYQHNKYMADVRYMSVMDGYMEEGFDGTIEYYNSDMIDISRFDREIIVKNWSKAMQMFNNDIDPTE